MRGSCSSYLVMKGKDGVVQWLYCKLIRKNWWAMYLLPLHKYHTWDHSQDRIVSNLWKNGKKYVTVREFRSLKSTL